MAEQGQVVLQDRVVIEPAEGVLAHRGDLDMDAAFAVRRRYAHDSGLRLSDVARPLVRRELPAQPLLDPPPGRPPAPRKPHRRD